MKLVKGKLMGGGATPGKGRAGVVEQPKKARVAGAEQGPSVQGTGHGGPWKAAEGLRGDRPTHRPSVSPPPRQGLSGGTYAQGLKRWAYV